MNKKTEVARPELISTLGELFADKIEEHDLSDEEIFFLLAKLLTLFVTITEKQECKAAAKMAFVRFIDMFHANRKAALKVTEVAIGLTPAKH